MRSEVGKAAIVVMSDNHGTWRNPPAVIRIAFVAGVYAALGVMGGLYVNLLPVLRIDPTTAASAGAVLMAAIGARLEAGSERSPDGNEC